MKVLFLASAIFFSTSSSAEKPAEYTVLEDQTRSFYLKSNCFAKCISNSKEEHEDGPKCSLFRKLPRTTPRHEFDTAAWECTWESQARLRMTSKRCLGQCPNAFKEAATLDVTRKAKDLVTKEEWFHKKYGTYTTDLKFLRFADGQDTSIYKIGFTIPMSKSISLSNMGDYRPTRTNTDVLVDSEMLRRSEFALKNDVPFSTVSHFCPNCSATRTGFRALFFTKVPESSKVDVWTVDQSGTLNHIVDGFSPLK